MNGAGGRLARLGRRLGSGGLTVVGVTLLAYVVMTSLPGDPLAARMDVADPGVLTADQRTALEREWGLDRPLPARYLAWLADLARGDLGRSIRSGRPVLGEIAGGLVPTLELNAAAFLLVAGLGVPLGWWIARRAGSGADAGWSVALVALYAVPSFWLAMILQQLLAVRLGLLPLYGRTPPSGGADALLRLRHLALPAATLALHGLAFYARFARNTAIEGLSSVHALFARSSGVGEARVFVQHAIRPSLVSLATLLGLSIPAFATGSVLIETLFSWPGLGLLFTRSIASRDLPVVLGLTVLVGVLTVFGSLLADTVTLLADPRAARDGGGAGRTA